MRAAELMVHETARLYEQGQPNDAEANIAKMLAVDASVEAGNVCFQTHGGFGFAEEIVAVDFDAGRLLARTLGIGTVIV
jgi:acyl-CoA dehydrogenase